MAKRYKCPYCDKRLEREKLIGHIEDDHEEMIPEKQTPTQVVFNYLNKKDHGTCIVCKKDTPWNEKAGRYDRLCGNPKCKEKLREEFKKNAMNKHGTYVYTADPKFQEKMLKGRKISSTYTFTDGGKVDYVGSYERKFLEFVDKVMNIESKDIIAPGPTIEYEYNGNTHYWITDFYYVPGNLVLDIKDGGKNPNNRPMEEYREKQIAKEASIRQLRKYNYLRLTDNNFGQFMEVLVDLKSMALGIREKQILNKINESYIEEISVAMMSVPPLYSSDASVLKTQDQKGNERTALSSLDFNDSILIEDPREGIKKVNKKYYKDNFVTKTQFLIPKDESYYNLLKSYKENNPCIHEGIYKNLSSFDHVISEDQIYFDTKFKLVEKTRIQEMYDKVKEVNNNITVIGESVLINNINMNIDHKISSLTGNINSLYNELKVELEANTDGFYIVTPSRSKENLDKQFQQYNAQNSGQKEKSDARSFALYGMSNYDHYYKLLSKIKKGTKDDELDGLEYNRHDEEIVKEESEVIDKTLFNVSSTKELDEKINKAKEINKTTLDYVVLYPTIDINELETLYMKYMALDSKERTASNGRTKEIFGMDNREIYKYIHTKLDKSQDSEGKIEIEKEVNESLITNDTPILSPDELKKIEEDYDCFSEDDAEKIRAWKGAYYLLGEGVKIPEYNKLNLERINILRKSLYQNNSEAIIQCGWIPGVEFNSQNRAKASSIIREKFDIINNNVISYDELLNESRDYNYKISKLKDSEVKDFYKNMKIVFNTKGSNNNIHKSMKTIKIGDEIIGYIGFSYFNEDGKKYLGIGNFMVLPKYQSSGHGRNIIKYIIEENKSKYEQIYCYVDKDNTRAINFYKKIGKVDTKNLTDYGYYVILYDKSKSINESYIEEANNIRDKKAVSIVLVSGKSILAKTIKKFQGNEFSHASISLDDDLKRIYSFNKKNGFNGFAYESIPQFIKEGVDKIGVYTFFVTDTVYKRLEKILEEFSLYRNKTKYSILNLLSIPLNIPLDLDMKMVCSEFVDKLLKAASIDLTNKKSYFVTPKDFEDISRNHNKIVEIYRGDIKKLNQNEIKNKINKLKRGNFPIYEMVEIDNIITEAKSFPIQFNRDGDLIIKNIQKINYEQEYSNSHRLLLQYEKSGAYDPMKFELAKMHFLIILLEKKIYKQGKEKSKEEIKVRARLLNDFNKYMKIVVENDKDFNFTEYYEQSQFNDAMIKIDNNTLKYGWKALKYMIK